MLPKKFSSNKFFASDVVGRIFGCGSSNAKASSRIRGKTSARVGGRWHRGHSKKVKAAERFVFLGHFHPTHAKGSLSRGTWPMPSVRGRREKAQRSSMSGAAMGLLKAGIASRKTSSLINMFSEKYFEAYSWGSLSNTQIRHRAIPCLRLCLRARLGLGGMHYPQC